MVSLSKIAIIGGALIFLGLFTQEAAKTGLTGTLQRTGLAGSSIGQAAASIGTGAGTGISGFFKGLLSPFWEIRNIIGGFMNIGAPALSVAQGGAGGQGGGSSLATGGGGGIDSCWPFPCAGAEIPPEKSVIPDIMPDQTSRQQPSGNITYQPPTWPAPAGPAVYSPESDPNYPSMYGYPGPRPGPAQSGGGSNISTGGGGGIAGDIGGTVGSSYVHFSGGSPAASSAAAALSAAAAAL